MGSRSLSTILALLFVLYLVAFAIGRSRAPKGPSAPAAVTPVAPSKVVVAAPKPKRDLAVRAAAARPPRPESVARALDPIETAFEAGRIDEAMNRLETILAGNPESQLRAESLIELARLQMVRKDFPAARQLFDKFLKEYPSHPQTGNVQRAIEFMDRYATFRASFVTFESEVR